MKKLFIYINLKDVVMLVKFKFKKNSKCMYLNVNIFVFLNDFREILYNVKSWWLIILFLGLCGFYFKILFIEYLFLKFSYGYFIYFMGVFIS